jgi:adenylate kinase
MTAKKRMILMMGGQGVGKGACSRALMANGKYKHVETGAILRSMPPDSDVAKTISAGNLVTDDMLFDIMKSEIDTDSDIILDGFPRKISQAKWLVDNYSDMFEIYVLYLSVPTEIMIQRINKRNREGGKRIDDSSPEIIQRRIDNYFKMTMPAIEWLRDCSCVRFSEIDASGDINDNMARIISALQK